MKQIYLLFFIFSMPLMVTATMPSLEKDGGLFQKPIALKPADGKTKYLIGNWTTAQDSQDKEIKKASAFYKIQQLGISLASPLGLAEQAEYIVLLGMELDKASKLSPETIEILKSEYQRANIAFERDVNTFKETRRDTITTCISKLNAKIEQLQRKEHGIGFTDPEEKIRKEMNDAYAFYIGKQDDGLKESMEVIQFLKSRGLLGEGILYLPVQGFGNTKTDEIDTDEEEKALRIPGYIPANGAEKISGHKPNPALPQITGPQGDPYAPTKKLHFDPSFKGGFYGVVSLYLANKCYSNLRASYTKEVEKINALDISLDKKKSKISQLRRSLKTYWPKGYLGKLYLGGTLLFGTLAGCNTVSR